MRDRRWTRLFALAFLVSSVASSTTTSSTLSLSKLRVYSMPVYPGRFVIRLGSSATITPATLAKQFTGVDQVFMLNGWYGVAGFFTSSDLTTLDASSSVADIFPDYMFSMAQWNGGGFNGMNGFNGMGMPQGSSWNGFNGMGGMSMNPGNTWNGLGGMSGNGIPFGSNPNANVPNGFNLFNQGITNPSNQVNTLNSGSTTPYSPIPNQVGPSSATGSFAPSQLRVQSQPPWYGLARQSYRSYQAGSNYVYPAQAGKYVDVYVLDTGIQADNPDFNGRVVGGYSSLPPDPLGTDLVFYNPFIDPNGHGTHVAGLIGSTTYGVAKLVNLHAVKVLYASDAEGGTLSSILGGIQWVEEQCEMSDSACLMNMSLTAQGRFTALDTVIESVKVPIITAAGNGVATSVGTVPVDACTVSPAGSPGAFAVGAIDQSNTVASFSNYGQCVQIFAPGVNAISLSATNPNGTATLTGTSQASAMMSGVAALYLGYCPTVMKYDLYVALIQYSTRNQVVGLNGAGRPVVTPDGGSPNRIGYVFPADIYISSCQPRVGFDFPVFSGMIQTGPTGVAVT